MEKVENLEELWNVISIVTPTYNRGYCMGNLYNSLKQQTSMDFEWIIVNDGSSDHTETIVKQWLREDSPFQIVYKKTENGGKHRAVNAAVKLACGEFIFIVDSDDILTNDAVEKGIIWCREIRDNNTFAGISGRKAYKDGTKLGSFPEKTEYIDAKNTDRRRKHLGGDKAEIYKTNILKKYPFPEFPGEKFLPESVVWDEIAHAGYKIRWYKDIIYLCDYQADGLTLNIENYVRNSFEGYSLAKNKSFHYLPFPYNWAALVSYLDMAEKMGKKKEDVIKKMDINRVYYSIAYVMYRIRKIISNK